MSARPLVAVVTAVLGAAGVIGAAGCKTTLDADRIERDIAAFFAAQLGPVDRVDCPDGVEPRPGAHFTCTVRFKDSPALTVEATHDERGNGHFALAQPVIATRALAPRIAAWLKARAVVDATVDCGVGVQPLPPAGYPCTARLPDGSQKTITVRTDAAGAVTWDVSP